MRRIMLILVLSTSDVFGYKCKNNVCKRMIDYYMDREHNPNCYCNPDVSLSVPKIIQRHGYPVETYSVTTQDGYILTVFRIPPKNATDQRALTPVFLQHGISLSSVCFVNLGKRSLAFVLSDGGYDVWLGNFRGSEYSNKHLYLNTKDERYWNFTFHENGVFDVAAQLDLAFNVTGRKAIYIGFSMGTTSYYIYNSIHPEVAQQRIKLSISMAPIAFLKYVDIPALSLRPIVTVLQNTIIRATKGVINERTPERISLRAKICLPYPLQMIICSIPETLIFGVNHGEIDPEILPIIVMQDTDAISIKTFLNYMQLTESGFFRQFDYGRENKRIYGSTTPTNYNMSNINVPNYFMRANNDILANQKNVEMTYSSLPENVKIGMYVVNKTSFTHSDFVVSPNAKELVYNHILHFVDAYNKI